MIKKTLLALVLVVCSMVSAHAMFWQLRYTGTIAGKQVKVALPYNTGDVATNNRPYWIGDGYYMYDNVGEVITLKNLNQPTNKTWIFKEYADGQYTGKWVVKTTKKGLSGTFIAPNGKKYPIRLTSFESEEKWDWAY